MKKAFPVILMLILLVAACQKHPEAEPNTALETRTVSDHSQAAESTPTEDLKTPSQPPSLEELLNEIGYFLGDLNVQGEFSGSVLIAYQDAPVFEAGFGLADRDLEIANQPDTKFNLGSLDKMFTAVAIIQLVEQGQISLEGLVGDYLPDYPNAEVAETVTIHQLLMHTSGMGSYFDNPAYFERFTQIRSLNDYFALFNQEGLLFMPGSQFGYSNSGYIVLGLIIEAVSGQSYFDYVQQNIFEPSGMTDTACYELDAGVPNLAIGYTTQDLEGNETGVITSNAFALPMRGGSAGGGYSTAPDLFAFGRALLGNQLLSQESTELLLEGKIDLRENVQYAYGFFDMVDHGYRKIGHGGGFPGICSIFNMFPEVDLTLVVLSNSDSDCMPAAEFIISVLLEYGFQP